MAVKQASQGMEIMEVGRRWQVIHGFHGQRKEGIGIEPLAVTKAAKQARKVLIDEARPLIGLLDDETDEPRSARGNGCGSTRDLRQHSRWQWR